MDKTVKIITTMDYLQSHDLSAFKGTTIRILIPNGSDKLSIEFVNKLFAFQITPEFIPVEPDQLAFNMGYVLGRALQSNGQIVLLAEGLKKPEYMAHANAFVLDDINQFAAAQKAVNKSIEDKNQSLHEEPRRGPGRPRSSSKTPKAPAPVAVPAQEPALDENTSAETGKAPVAEPEQKTTSTKASKHELTAEDIQQLKTMLNKLGAMAVVKKYEIPEDEFFSIFTQSVKDAYEYVSYEAQLEVRIQDLAFVKEFYKLTKNSFDKFKKIVDKI